MSTMVTEPKPARWFVQVYTLGVSFFHDERGGYIDGEGRVADFRSKAAAERFAEGEQRKGNAAHVCERAGIRWVNEWPEGWWEWEVREA